MQRKTQKPDLSGMRPITELQEIKDIVLSIMTAVHNYCEENKITYYLAYGTLLGAVRHNGFIPWDDDIDIWMPRPDYERFLREFPAYGKTHNLFLSSYMFSEHYFPADFTKGNINRVCLLMSFHWMACLIKIRKKRCLRFL